MASMLEHALIISVTVLFCCSPTLSQDTCGHIGNNDERNATPSRNPMLYLDTDNRANCSGNITSVRVCYYGPDSIPNNMRRIYRTTYAVYRQLEDEQGLKYYRRVSGTFTAIRVTSNVNQNANPERDGPIDTGFNCYNDTLYTNTNGMEGFVQAVTVEEGDIVGACIVDAEDRESEVNSAERLQLDIVGEESGHSLMHTSTTECQLNTIPLQIPIGNLTSVGSRKLHLYAKIEGDVTTVTSSLNLGFSVTASEIMSEGTVSVTIQMAESEVTTDNIVPVTNTRSFLAPTKTFQSTVHSDGTTSENITADSKTKVTTVKTNDPSEATRSRDVTEVITRSIVPTPSPVTKNYITSIHTEAPSLLNEMIELSFTISSELQASPTPSSMAAVLTSTTVPTKESTPSLQEISGLFVNVPNVNVSTKVHSLGEFLNTLGDQIVDPALSEAVFSQAGNILDTNLEDSINSQENFAAGSTLLRVLDNFALNNHNDSVPFTSDRIVVRGTEVSVSEANKRIPLIEDEAAEISIPREVLTGLGEREQVRVASLLFRNMTGFLPERLEENNRSDADLTIFRLASPVISASLQCDSCTINNLSDPVEVTFAHLPYDTALLENDGSVTCVFWEFDETEGSEGILVPGRWSSEGCETNFTSTMTVCKCNHLTHFAILLSARPLELSKAQTLSLQITGYIGVSVSLVAMAATILVFVFLKPLRTMRNYIHIQLCVSLGIAQIIFVAGIQPQLGEEQLVPVGCRLVAVLLHYWFLVSFMWMLMEGVVLYVALVRVFVKYHARYIAAFTIASYGLPLLYVGALTVPLGFARTNNYRQNESYDYGYEQACYLNPTTNFIWSIIAPVILIFMANLGFFIMAITIMYRHQKRQRTTNAKKFRYWLKSSLSLTMVMGITWIIGVLVIEVDQLFALAYIFTIFVAFQGLFIFVIFVLLSKLVRGNYVKWWKGKVSESDFLSKHFGDKSLTLGSSFLSNKKVSDGKKFDHLSSSSTSKKEFEASQVIENSYASDYKPSLASHSLSRDLKSDVTNENVEETELKRRTDLDHSNNNNDSYFTILYLPKSK